MSTSPLGLIASLILVSAVALAHADAVGAADPPARTRHSFTSNGMSSAAQSRLYLFGGDNLVNSLNDLWFYRVNTGWSKVEFRRRDKQPSPRAEVAWSCGGGQCLAVGGTIRSDDWIFDESSSKWSKIKCVRTPCPSARFSATSAYDPLIGQHVLFGGQATGGFIGLDDTFVFDRQSGSWIEKNPFSRPSPRWNAAAAFVPSHGLVSINRVVLFGGMGVNQPALCDLWSWSGTDWTAISAGNQRPCLHSHSMAWEAEPGQSPHLIVTGGVVDNVNTANTATWYFTFDSSTSGSWSTESFTCDGGGTPQPQARMALDIPTQKKIFFGGAERIDGEWVPNGDTMVCN